MFRIRLLSSFLFLTTALTAAAPAQAADVQRVSLDVTIVRSSLASDDLDAVFRVTGTGLNNGTLTTPVPNSAPIALVKDGDDLVIEDDLANEAELSSLLPSGNYVLKLNNDAIEVMLAYARPGVPSPAISAPSAGSKVAPGTVAIQFAACAVCNLTGDTVTAELEDGAATLLDQELLTASTITWTPQGASGPLALPEDSDFVARVTHRAVREATATVNDDDGNLVFSHAFVQSDEVDFATGFARPVGHVCVAASYAAAPPGCALVPDVGLQVLDVSGVFAGLVDGHTVEVTLAHAANGALTGSAAADLDDDGTPDTNTPSIRGRVRGKNGEVVSRYGYALANPALAAKLKLKVREDLSIAGNTRAARQRATGAIGSSKVKETTTVSGALPFAPLGWLLELDIDGQGGVSNAVLTLEGGRSFALTGSDKFKLGSGRSRLKLRSSDKAVRVALKGVSLDDATSPLGVSGGTLKRRALGQSAKALLP